MNSLVAILFNMTWFKQKHARKGWPTKTKSCDEFICNKLQCSILSILGLDRSKQKFIFCVVDWLKTDLSFIRWEQASSKKLEPEHNLIMYDKMCWGILLHQRKNRLFGIAILPFTWSCNIQQYSQDQYIKWNSVM